MSISQLAGTACALEGVGVVMLKECADETTNFKKNQNKTAFESQKGDRQWVTSVQNIIRTLNVLILKCVYSYKM